MGALPARRFVGTFLTQDASVLPLLRETLRLLLTHLDLFTRITLTVWLPATVVASYQDFFAGGERDVPRGLGVVLTTELLLGPLVAAAIIAALARIVRGIPVSYGEAMAHGLAAWPRLFVVRFVTGLIVVGGLLLLVVPGLVFLVRYAVVDPAAVLEGAGPTKARRRSIELTSGQRRDVVLIGGALFLALGAVSIALSSLIQLVPALNHFVVRVLLDCAFAVAQSVFTIALFLLYQRGLAGSAASASPAASAA
jgi:Uncharacterised protein family (UPF0259)